MKRYLVILGILAALVAILVTAIPTPAADQPANAPRIHVKAGTSTNWSGYATLTDLTNPQGGVINDVKGSWKVPSVVGTSNAWSSIWVGIDGYSSSSVEQIGTEQDWYNGAPRYYAWYEMYPKPSYMINKPVKPGDTMNAEVQYKNGSFILTLSDVGKWSFSITQKSNKAQRSSAEWIVEAPWSGGVLPLANFGSATFTNASFNNNLPITAAGWQNDRIDMVNSSGGLKAQTSGTDGSSFSVTWKNSN